MKKRIIGIDPGKSGGIAILYERGNAEALNITSECDLLDVLRACRDTCEEDVYLIAYLELVGGFIGGTGNTGSSMFKFGSSFGFVQGAMMALRIPFKLVSPKRWQRDISGLAGLQGAARKRALKNEAVRRYPSLKPTLKTADAILIADYGRMVEK